MSDIKVRVLRGKDLTSYEANRIYRILTSVSNGNIYGKETGMLGRLKEALQAGAKFSRLFVATDKRDGAGVGFFYCDTREGHREFRVKLVVASEYKNKGVRQILLGDILSHAKHCAFMLKRDIILDVVCKPSDTETNSFCGKEDFFCPPRLPLEEGEEYNPLDINIHRKLICYEDSDKKKTG